MRLLEEVLAAAAAGRVHNLHTLGEAHCNLTTACASAGEWERAAEWCEIVDESPAVTVLSRSSSRAVPCTPMC